MTTSAEQVRLPDGRELEVVLGGDPAGLPIVLHHGTPGHATTYVDWDDACTARGLRLVAAARPGYGASTRAPGRRVADAAADTAAVLDHLGAGEFLTAGWSGGGPHTLACAALLPSRCLAAASLAGVGAYGQDDLDFLAGMGEENIDEFGVATKGEDALRDWMAANAEPMRRATAAELAEAFGGLVPQVDKDVLNEGYADVLHASMQRGLEHGFDGWIDDDLAFVQPWGFELGAIGVPVRVWQGDLDLMVPQAHAPWLAGKIPEAESHVVPGHGHLSLVTVCRGEILDDLAAAVGR